MKNDGKSPLDMKKSVEITPGVLKNIHLMWTWYATFATNINLAGHLCLAETLTAHITSWQQGCRWKLASIIIYFCLFSGNSVKIFPIIRRKLDYRHAYCSVRLHVHKPCFHAVQFYSNCSLCFPSWNFCYHLGHGCKPAEQWRDNTADHWLVTGNRRWEWAAQEMLHKPRIKIKIAKLPSAANGSSYNHAVINLQTYQENQTIKRRLHFL